MISLEPTPFLELTHEGQPIPWQRAGRGRRGQSFTPEPYRSFKEGLAWSMRLAMRRRPALRDPLAISVVFHRQGEGVADLDNLLKAVGDAGNTIVWADDRLIRGLREVWLLTGVVEHPRLELTVWQIASAPKDMARQLRGAAG